jgi:membrane-bound lytic murein transglycosylase D
MPVAPLPQTPPPSPTWAGTRRQWIQRTVLFAALPFSAYAQWDNLLDTGRRLLESQLDPAFAEAIRTGDPDRLATALQPFLQRLQADEVIDLAGLADAAHAMLPLLDAHTETSPYASWLRSRIDYFDVAHRLEKATPKPKPAPGQPTPRPLNPTPKQSREAWEQEMAKRPPPRGAQTWVPRLKPVLRRSGIAPALVWLAEIESSFNPDARSPAGALGMYQLMPATAQELGLKLQPRDERLNPEKNAAAAASYLRRLHRQFKDWSLTLAAYNAGPGRVSRTLQSRRAHTFEAIAPSLPAETQMYVPKFAAVLRRREGLSLAALPSP